MSHVLPTQSRVIARASLALLVLSSIAIALAACSDAKHATNRKPKSKPSAGGGPTDAGRAGDAGPAIDASTDTSCHTDAGQRLVCDASKVAGVSWGPAVIVKQGSGAAPSPKGGLIVPGAYQLVSETLYGSVPPDVLWERPGQAIDRILHVDCDVMNELYTNPIDVEQGAGPVVFPSAGVDCRRLVPHELNVIDVAGLIASSGPPIPDLRDEIAYTAKGQRLTLFFLLPYEDFGSGRILGSYTTVAEFVLVGGDGAGAAEIADAGGGGEIAPIAHTKRDPRCPATPPAQNDACSPDPAPLECEYGGDALRHCTTLATCVVGLDGTSHFQIDPPGECPPRNDHACPASFTLAQVMVGEQGGTDAGLRCGACNYPEGVCGCDADDGCAWTCRTTASVLDKRTGQPCPWPRPLAGDPCVSGSFCEYQALCNGETTFGPSMACQNGYWAQASETWHGCRPPGLCSRK